MDEATTETRFSTEEEAIAAPPALDLEIDDSKLIEFIDSYIKNAKSFYNDEKKIDKRRERNEKYIFGRQLEDIQIKSHEKKYMDNVIKEGEDMLRPIVLSRLPDLIVKAGVEGDEDSSARADRISKVVSNTLHSRELKKVLTKAFRHHPVYFTGVIKYRWDAHKGKFGDLVFEVIHPKNILVDHTATENNEKEMNIIVHYVEKPLKEWILMFPDKEQELMSFAERKGKIVVKDGNVTEQSLAANLKIPEIWFDWFEKADDFDPENPKFNFMSGVCWKIDKVLLDKRQNPNWDWEGEEKLFINGQPVPEELLPQLALLGFEIPGLERVKTFRNFFGQPRKPFIFMGFEQWGQMPLDETSRIEQNIDLQDNYDKRGMQITKMIDDARGKHVFSTMSGLRKETIEQMDLDDPTEDVVIDGDLRQVHAFISKEQPSDAMFGDLARSRERMLAKVNVHGPTRGEIQTSTATTNQIAREADFTVADDLADDTIVEVTSQMAEALLHMMKLRYEEDHFRAILGEEGDETFLSLKHDIIEDGMEVDVVASGTDKLRAEREAKEEAQLGLIDPLTYYKDTGRNDPEGRAEKLFLFQTNPELYFKKFVRGEDIPDIAEQVQLLNQQNLAQGSQAGVGQPPLAPSPQDTTNIAPTPQGSPRGLIGRATGAVKQLFNR